MLLLHIPKILQFLWAQEVPQLLTWVMTGPQYSNVEVQEAPLPSCSSWQVTVMSADCVKMPSHCAVQVEPAGSSDGVSTACRCFRVLSV